MSELKPANRFQEAFGLPVAGARTKVKDHMEESVMDFIRSSPFAVLATNDQGGHCDASPRGGTPGFVRVIDKRHLLLPDVAGNRLFQSYGNVDDNGHVGLLLFLAGITPCASTGARPIDQTEVDTLQTELWSQHDDNTKLVQGLLMDEAYGHCTRAMSFSTYGT